MSDARLRALERRFQETGAAEDELAFLIARVRAGDRLRWVDHRRLAELDLEAAASHLASRTLPLDRLEAAARCGEPASQQLTGLKPARSPFALLQTSSSVPTLLVRACLALIRPYETPRLAQDAVAAVEAWLRDPACLDEDALERLQRAHRTALDVANYPRARQLVAARLLTDVVQARDAEQALRRLEMVASRLDAEPPPGQPVDDLERSLAAPRAESARQLQQLVEALLPWLLELDDSLR